jgi:hypothetical protein
MLETENNVRAQRGRFWAELALCNSIFGSYKKEFERQEYRNESANISEDN